MLEFYNSNTLFIRNITPLKDITFFFPNGNSSSIEREGRYIPVSGVYEGITYIYLRDNNSIYFSRTQWDREIDGIRYLGSNSFLLGLVAINNSNEVTGPWSVVSAINQPEISTRVIIPFSNSSSNVISIPYLLNDRGMTTSANITGSFLFTVYVHDYTLHNYEKNQWNWSHWSYNYTYSLSTLGTQRFGTNSVLHATVSSSKSNDISSLSYNPNWQWNLTVSIPGGWINTHSSFSLRRFEEITVNSTSTFAINLTRSKHI